MLDDNIVFYLFNKNMQTDLDEGKIFVTVLLFFGYFEYVPTADKLNFSWVFIVS